MADSGSPFNITIGQDLNGDNQYNDRPAYATASSTDVMQTAYGNFDLTPAWNATRIPYNHGTGPAQFSMKLRVTRPSALARKRKADRASLVSQAEVQEVLAVPAVADTAARPAASDQED